MKNVIVAGGNGGIGRVIVKGFLREGAQVLILDTKISQQVKTIVVDVSDRKQVNKIGDYIRDELDSRVDVLVNAAGICGPIGKLENLDPEMWQKTIMVNLLGTVNMCALVIPFMKKSGGGSIINFSGGGEGPLPRYTAYSSSKAAVLRFTESLAKELSKYNIFVNAVAPGPVNTSLLIGKDFVSPNYVRDLVLFLVSGKAKNLSGKIISAIHDNWKNLVKHLKIINKTDIYNIRRIKPIDRKYDW